MIIKNQDENVRLQFARFLNTKICQKIKDVAVMIFSTVELYSNDS